MGLTSTLCPDAIVVDADSALTFKNLDDLDSFPLSCLIFI